MEITSYGELKEPFVTEKPLPVVPVKKNFDFLMDILYIITTFWILLKILKRFRVACPLSKLHRFVHIDNSTIPTSHALNIYVKELFIRGRSKILNFNIPRIKFYLTRVGKA